MSPKADCPASKPTNPGSTEPSTWPQIPLMQRPPTSSLPATMMSQVDVPMIRVSIPGATDAPTAPIWASSAPTATAIPWGSPSLSAHSGVSSPALVSLVWVSVNRWGSISFKAGLSSSRTSPEGRPQLACHIALCPAAQRLRKICSGIVLPVTNPVIQSQCSTQA